MTKTAYYFYLGGNSHIIEFVVQCWGPCGFGVQCWIPCLPHYPNHFGKERESRTLYYFMGDVHS